MPRDAEIVSPRAGLVRAALGAWAVLIYVFLFAPIVLLVAFAFNANKYGTFPFTGWTTKWYGQVFGDYQIRDALTTTLRVAVEVTLISTVVGTAAAFPLVRSRLPFRSGVRIAFTLPIMIPGLLIGVSLLVLLTSTFHFQLSPQTAVIGQAVYTTPFVLLIVAARLQHVAHLHLHTGEVRHHAGGQRASVAAPRRVADAHHACFRAAGCGAPCAARGRCSAVLGFGFDVDPAAVPGAAYGRSDRGDAAVAFAKGRERRVLLSFDGRVD